MYVHVHIMCLVVKFPQQSIDSVHCVLLAFIFRLERSKDLCLGLHNFLLLVISLRF